jgi:hypothetical protein
MALVKPEWPALQRDNPLSRGIQVMWALSEGSGNKVSDLSGNQFNPTFNGTWLSGPAGSTAHTDGSSTQVVLTRTPGQLSPNIQAGDFTVALRFLVTTLGSYTIIFDGFDDFYGRIYSLFLNAAGGAGTVFWGAGGNAVGGGQDNISVGTTITVNTWYDLAVTRKGALSSFYIGGKLGVTDSNETNTNNATSTTRVLSLGGNPSGGGTKEPTHYDYFAAWNRALTANEIAQFTQDPFAVVRPHSRWWEVPAAAGAFTNRPGPSASPALPFGLAIAGAKLLERNPTMRRRELFRWVNRGENYANNDRSE